LKKFDVIPTQVEDLRSLIRAPLLRKLPVTADEEIVHPELKNYIYTRDDERRSTIAKNITNVLSSSVDKGFSGNKSESMLHFSLDSMIRIPLETFLVVIYPLKSIGTSQIQEQQQLALKDPIFFVGLKIYLFLRVRRKQMLVISVWP
jgi:hypothetical protein